MSLAKVLSLVLAAVVILNFIGLLFKIVKPAAFWLVTVVAAITAYWVIPKLKKRMRAQGGTRTPE
ncbi:hypothetical protein HYU40_03160 [Candidatus Woesearchaeota archaeon]|nr:hypothetical protein [Candidatus Woesearchaeota archaeon]